MLFARRPVQLTCGTFVGWLVSRLRFGDHRRIGCFEATWLAPAMESPIEGGLEPEKHMCFNGVDWL
jgi:hypothetical protein